MKGDPFFKLRLYVIALAASAFMVFMLAFAQYAVKAIKLTYFPDKPVLRSTVDTVESTPDYLVLHFTVTLSATECTYLRMQAYHVGEDGTHYDTNILRLDIVERGDTKPRGKTYDIGNWKIWPKRPGLPLEVVVQHLCEDGVVSTVLASIPPK